MNLDIDRGVTVNGTVGGAAVTVSLCQAAGAGRPTGMVRLSGLNGGRTLTLLPSILQTTGGWASVTGLAGGADGTDEAVTLQMEQADPFAGGKPTLTVLVDGEPMLEGPVTGGTVMVAENAGGERQS